MYSLRRIDKSQVIICIPSRKCATEVTLLRSWQSLGEVSQTSLWANGLSDKRAGLPVVETLHVPRLRRRVTVMRKLSPNTVFEALGPASRFGVNAVYRNGSDSLVFDDASKFSASIYFALSSS